MFRPATGRLAAVPLLWLGSLVEFDGGRSPPDAQPATPASRYVVVVEVTGSPEALDSDDLRRIAGQFGDHLAQHVRGIPIEYIAGRDAAESRCSSDPQCDVVILKQRPVNRNIELSITILGRQHEREREIIRNKLWQPDELSQEDGWRNSRRYHTRDLALEVARSDPSYHP